MKLEEVFSKDVLTKPFREIRILENLLEIITETPLYVKNADGELAKIDINKLMEIIRENDKEIER